jgi:hypothetical protein
MRIVAASMARRRPSEPPARSLRRRLVGAHRRLDALFARTGDAVRGDGPAAALRALTGLRHALETHFLQEENLYYPPLVTLRPRTRPALQEAIRAHEEFRAALEELVALLARGGQADAVRRFTSFRDAFTRHEAAEERALEALGGEIAGT